MGNCEEAKNCKPDVTSSPPKQQTGHVYPDWATMQAYYGPRMAVPPYFNSTVTSGHAPPPYMWGPLQHMMPPYAAIYPHAGVYAHPGVTVAATSSPMHVDSPAKSSGNSDRGLIKKLKGFDGLAMSIGNENGISHSGETEGSSEGSDGNTTEGAKSGQKRSRGSSTSSEVGKIDDQLPSANENESFKKVTSLTVTPANLTMMPAMVQSDRELKRERRKQSNRESARRSRLRKQAEAEGLGTKVESLTNENLTLKSEINRLTVNSSNLKLQNAKLLEKLKNAQIEQDKEDPRVDKKVLSLSTANLLSIVDNGSGSETGTGTGTGTDTDTTATGATLRQLLDSSPRADAVAAV